MNVGQKFSLRWKHPHRIEATITELRQNDLVAEVDHRCPPSCFLQASRSTLPIHGTLVYRYEDFANLFQPMAEDALALPGGK